MYINSTSVVKYRMVPEHWHWPCVPAVASQCPDIPRTQPPSEGSCLPSCPGLRHLTPVPIAPGHTVHGILNYQSINQSINRVSLYSAKNGNSHYALQSNNTVLRCCWNAGKDRSGCRSLGGHSTIWDHSSELSGLRMPMVELCTNKTLPGLQHFADTLYT